MLILNHKDTVEERMVTMILIFGQEITLPQMRQIARKYALKIQLVLLHSLICLWNVLFGKKTHYQTMLEMEIQTQHVM